jgi:hypothetical protein
MQKHRRVMLVVAREDAQSHIPVKTDWPTDTNNRKACPHKHSEDQRAAKADMALIVSHALAKEAFVADYNDRRYHESIDNLTPADDLLRARPDNPAAERKDQTPDHRPTPLAAFNGKPHNIINQRSQSLY